MRYLEFVTSLNMFKDTVNISSNDFVKYEMETQIRHVLNHYIFKNLCIGVLGE